MSFYKFWTLRTKFTKLYNMKLFYKFIPLQFTIIISFT